MEDPLFRPESLAWTPVSTRLITLRRLTVAVPVTVAGLLGVLGCVLTIVLGAPLIVSLLIGALAALVVAVGIALWIWSPRHQRSWGYAEAEDDLLVTSGVLFRRLVAVPYGRLQFIDVSVGPLERMLTLARVTVHTASTETAAVIPGLLPDEARRLRDRLTELARTRDAGV